MWLLVLSLIAGVLLGAYLPLQIPLLYGRYLSIGVLAALDSIFGGLRASLEGTYDNTVFITGFFANTLLAALLTYIGDRLGVDLYYAALFAFGFRLFTNLGVLRRLLLKQWKSTGTKPGGQNLPINKK